MDIEALLYKYLEKYCEETKICLKNDIKKKNHNNTAFDYYDIPRPIDDSVIGSLNTVGQVIDVNYEEHIYVALVSVGKFGSNEAFFVAKMDNSVLFTAAFFKEGIINQHIANKALEIVKERMTLK